MLIVALVLAVIGLAALVTAVVTSNELIAWVCIGASVIGVVLLIVDALRERSRGDADGSSADTGTDEIGAQPVEDYPDDATTQIPTAHADTEDETSSATVVAESQSESTSESHSESTPAGDQADAPATRD